MHSDMMSLEVERFLKEANDLQWKKNADYHPDRVAFLEILRTACECGITVEQDLWAKIRKQYVALRNFAIDGKVESEPPQSRMMDIAVYMGMLAFWTEHRKRILVDAYAFVNQHTGCQRGAEHCGPHNTQLEICDRCRFQFWLARN